jgi:hypothetical protein
LIPSTAMKSANRLTSPRAWISALAAGVSDIDSIVRAAARPTYMTAVNCMAR